MVVERIIRLGTVNAYLEVSGQQKWRITTATQKLLFNLTRLL
jgi:hypothetical protein